MKKIITFMLAIALLVTSMSPVMASGSTSADKGLENAIKAVKERISIPADCSKFTYNIYNREGMVIWNLGWSNEKDQKYINVTIDENNFISNYSSYQYSSKNEKKLPKLSKSQGEDIAEKFVNKLNPALLSEFMRRDNSDRTQDKEYYYSYVRRVNGIDFPEDTISISVDNYTGQVTNFSCGYSKNTKFESADKVISLEQAKKAYIEKLGLKLVYNYKNENDKVIAYLAYVPKDSYKYIDAITGEVEKTSRRPEILHGASKEKMAIGDSTAEVALTPEEIDAVKDMAGLLTKEELDSKVRAISQFKLDSGFSLTSAELGKEWRNKDSLAWYLRYTKVINKETNQIREVSVSLDARSGDILDFWTYYDSPADAKPQETKEDARKISDVVLESLIPSHYAKVKYDDTYYSYDEAQNQQFNFRYVRVENGLECPGDYITITYDNLSGNVTSINSNWTKDLKFGDTKNAIAIEKAYNVLFDNNMIGYGIQYIGENGDANAKKILTDKSGPDKAVLGYLINSSKPCIINAETGDVLNYSGVAYSDINVTDYTDIKGLYAENKIKILTQLSIRYQENELKANEQLLQKDYFIILCQLNDLYYFESGVDKGTAVERMYDNLINTGIITKAEKAPTSTLTREEAAKFFVRFLRLDQVAEIKGIFKSDFKDASKINPELLGYVCIASGLKAMNGSNGYFNPKNKMTRLEGLLTIFGYLDNK